MNTTASRVRVAPAGTRVRAMVGKTAVADSVDALLLEEAGRPPVYYLPLKDVRTDLLVPTAHSSHCPLKGDASYYSLRAPDGRLIENAVWRYANPKDLVPGIADCVAFYGHAIDRWIIGEDEPVPS